MQLCLLTNGDFNNRKVWSGTPWQLYRSFSQLDNLDISAIDYSLPRLWKSFCAHAFSFSNNEFVIGGSRDPWYRFWMEHRLKQELAKKTPTGWRLFVCDHNCPKARIGKERYAIYVDGAVEIFWKYLKGNTFWRKWYENYVRQYEQASIQNADLIFTQNEWSRKFYIDEWGISEEKVHNVGFGVNLQPLSSLKDYFQEELLIVLRHGTEHYKGLYLLLDAFERLRKRHSNVKLHVVGTTNRPLEGVTYWDNYPRSKTVELFQKATLYVMPAIREPNGITYLEGLANKAPIVGLNRFAVPEFSGYGKWGFLCNQEDPEELATVLEDALSDKQRLAEMGKLGQDFVIGRYDRTKVVINMKDAMEALS